jgi:glyoxylase-like metal-dependent hydrolase (beta-lactamase superfamily II)
MQKSKRADYKEGGFFMNIKQMALGPLGTNCYIVYDKRDAMVIDPGGEPAKVKHFIDKKELTPAAILLTHAHFDHIGGVDELRNHYGVEVYLHEKEADWLTDASLNGSALFTGERITTKAPDQIVTPGTIEIGPFRFEAIHTPGHSPGSVSFLFREKGMVISGDVLFNQGIGRTDLPGGDINVLEASIRNVLYKLEDHFLVYPGHGSATAIGEEKRNNPFFTA